VSIPWNILLIAGEAAIVSFCVEAVFLVFMVESFHRLSPVSPLLNIPAGAIAGSVTPLGLILIFLPAPLARLVGWVIALLLTALLKLLVIALRLPGATLRVPLPPVS